VWAVSALLLLAAAGPAAVPAPPIAKGECAAEDGVARCLFRSFVPSIGIVSSCRGRECRVGWYYGDPADPSWLEPPPGLDSLPPPEVLWLTGSLAQIRFECGPACSWSYFFEVTRRRLSAPRAGVLAADHRRQLAAMAEGRALAVRQMFSGREVIHIERDWAPGRWLGEVVTAIHFDPDGRLSFTWLRGPDRTPVTERVSVPSIPRS
jgi:hypothetical protein